MVYVVAIFDIINNIFLTIENVQILIKLYTVSIRDVQVLNKTEFILQKHILRDSIK